MRYRYSRLLVIAILALALAACGGELATDGGVSGTWSGQISGPGGQTPLTLELTQTGVSVEGSLTLSGASLGLTGTAVNNIISLSSNDERSSVQLEGSVDGDVMEGTIAVLQADGEIDTADFTAAR
jgi:hypothetical protein